jgi:hypothetical protein
MAEPLTSSDMWRIRSGWGASPTASIEERKRFAAAGELPLSSENVARLAEGRGISPMASTAEKEAWVASEVMTGQRDPMDLPKAYGGMGDRPEATTRRGLRMQQEWDKQYEIMMEEQKMAQQMEYQKKQLESQERDQYLQENEFYYDRGLKEAEQKLTAQQRAEARSIVESLNQLDPRSPDFNKNLSNIFTQNSLGASDPNVQKIVGLYTDANNSYMNSLEKQQSGQKQAQEDFFKTQQALLESGVPEQNLSKFYDPDAPAGVIRFNPDAVTKQLGTTKFQEKQTAAEKKEETPKDKINLDLRQAYGELNELLVSGEDTKEARAKVAGLRERYKSAVGEDAPEVLPNPSNKEQYDRLPSGTFYIGKDGKIKTKQ